MVVAPNGMPLRVGRRAQSLQRASPSLSVGEARACRGIAALYDRCGRDAWHGRCASHVARQVEIVRRIAGVRRIASHRIASHRIASQTSSDAESTRWMSSMQSSVGGSEASAIRAMSSDLSSDDVSSYRTWVSTLEYPETPLSRLKSTPVDPLGTSHISARLWLRQLRAAQWCMRRRDAQPVHAWP